MPKLDYAIHMITKLIKHIFLEPTARKSWDQQRQAKTARREREDQLKQAQEKIAKDQTAGQSSEHTQAINDVLEVYRVKRKMIDDLPPGPKAKLELMAKVMLGIPAKDAPTPTSIKTETVKQPVNEGPAPTGQPQNDKALKP